MSFVFYDTETTDTATAFDQILQFAAIKTNAELEEIDRFEITSRLLPHVVPHPGALRVTRISIDRVTDPTLPSHYEMVRAIREQLMKWSPAVFIGYNSLNFDEHLLRQALFQTLHPPYFTNTQGNGRTDLMTLAQVATEFVDDALKIPSERGGRPVFKLDRLALANGFNHLRAHEAIGDVEATVHLARLIRYRAPELWQRFIQFSAKSAVAEFVDNADAFLVTEMHFNRPQHYAVACFGRDPAQNTTYLCLDLSLDQSKLSALSDHALANLIERSPKPIRWLRANTGPIITPLEETPERLLGGLDRTEIRSRAAKLKSDQRLKQRLLAGCQAAQPNQEPSPHIEEQIYDGFPSREDELRMASFHAMAWEQRPAIVESFEDDRLRMFVRRLLYAERPELLAEAHRDEIESFIADRLMATDQGKDRWTSLPAALRGTEAFLATANGSEAALLREFRTYLVGRIQQFGERLQN